MNKYIKIIPRLLTLLLGLAGLALHAQSFQWVNSAGPIVDKTSIVQTKSSKVFVDSKENVYFCFDFQSDRGLRIAGERVFVPNGLSGQCTGVACYDCQGELKWYRTFFGKDKYSRPRASYINTAAMIDDTLVLCFYGSCDSVYVSDSARVLDTVACTPAYALWLSTDSGRVIRTAHTGTPLQLHYYNNRLHVVGPCSAYDSIPGMMDDSCYVQIFTPQGEKIRHLSLDYSTSFPHEPTLQTAVYHDKYYFLYPMSHMDSCQFGSQHYVGRDTLLGNTVFACFDSTGRCLWSRLLNSWLSPAHKTLRIAIDEPAGLIYLAGDGCSYNDWMIAAGADYMIFDGDTLWNDENGFGLFVLACYDTLGNKQWVKHSRGVGALRSRLISILPNHKLALSGMACSGDAILEGFHSNCHVGYSGFFTIYDCVKDSFVLLQTIPKKAETPAPEYFATDIRGNLYFSGDLYRNDYVVCGSDTIRSIGAAATVFYGRYGWGCDTVAHWPGPPRYTLTLDAGQEDMGFVTGGGTYSGGSQVPISATPYPGHTFDHWSDGRTANPRTIYLVTDSALTAHFAKIQTEPEGVTAPDGRSMPQLYPNPATGQVQFLGNNGELLYVEIFDITGCLVASFRHTSAFDISHLPSAPYIVKIHTPDGQVCQQKLIKE